MAKPLSKTTFLFTKVILIFSIVHFSCAESGGGQKKLEELVEQVDVEVSEPHLYPNYLLKLDKYYGHHFTILNKDRIIWCDEDTIFLDDRKVKSIDECIDSPDIEDQFCQSYPVGKAYRIPDSSNQDPGRIRNEDFFRRMYGNSEEEVMLNLKELKWLPSLTGIKLKVNTVNGCYDSLLAVCRDLELLDTTLLKYVTKTAGTFKWRTIAGTERLSCHSFGIAIDINVTYSNYWKWDEETGNRRYKNKIPMEIVEVFEKYGFIWGGKWYHYDTMHFEFRPELL